MGQNLYDPPDVAGWDFGQGLVLDRLDARAHELRVRRSRRISGSGSRRPPRRTPRRPTTLLSFVLESMRTRAARQRRRRGAGRLSARDRRRGPAARRSFRQKVPGLVHLVASTAEYQFV